MANQGTVLVVEDDPDLREIYGQILLEGGWTVVSAGDGMEAIDRLEALKNGQTPCAVLLDLRMPRMDGWQLTEALQRDERWLTVPIVIVAAHYRVADEARRLRAFEWLLKPVPADRLLYAVDQACRAAPAAH
jgi:CheY-like chemotaxis protein